MRGVRGVSCGSLYGCWTQRGVRVCEFYGFPGGDGLAVPSTLGRVPSSMSSSGLSDIRFGAFRWRGCRGRTFGVLPSSSSSSSSDSSGNRPEYICSNFYKASASPLTTFLFNSSICSPRLCVIAFSLSSAIDCEILLFITT